MKETTVYHNTTVPADLPERLRQRLLSLSYPAFEAAVEQVLLRSGYADVLFSRTRYRGHCRRGGSDAVAASAAGLQPVRVALQLKQSRTAVAKLSVDQLRGAALRLGAHTGVMVTAGSFSPVAASAALASALIPVRLIDGTELAGLMAALGIGVAEVPATRLDIDEEYFQRLGGTR